MSKGRLGLKRSGPGRPRTDHTIKALIIRLAKENPSWGQMRIASMLVPCLITLSPRTIAAIFDRHGLRPASQRSTDWSWKRFITEHLDVLVATDFFTVDVWGLLGKRRYDVLFAIHLASRRVEIMGITKHSNQDPECYHGGDRLAEVGRMPLPDP